MDEIMRKSYTIGLDIGTNSVGWAVLTDDYQLVRKKMKVGGNTEMKALKKNFWGVRLFDEGKTAADRRMKRTARRRYTRRRNRLNYLRDIFSEEMEKIDANFFHRLDETFLVVEDKIHERHPIFGTLEDEVQYQKYFPTIYHLRKHLADSDEIADLRLVYLAMAHIIKYRGNFLIEGKLNTENSSVEGTFKEFLKEFNRIFSRQLDGSYINFVDENTKASEKFNENKSRTRIFENVLKLFPGEKSSGTFAQFLKLIVGNQANFKSSFGLNEDAKIQFSKEDYEEVLEELLSRIGDEYADVFLAAKNVFDAVELAGILTVKDKKTRAKLSASMIERYEEHRKDLAEFKQVIRSQYPDSYYEIFKDSKKDGYAGYIEGKTTQEEFYKFVKKKIEKLTDVNYFIEKMDQENFLRKQRTFDNGVIPHQIHLEELKAIIAKQAIYYPFLHENQDKIETILTFRIPYYVGPLACGQSNFAWLTRKNDGQITPWNFEENIDFAKSATDFIDRMTNNDSYLPSEKVLPKHSMLYEKYTIFNELTKVKYKDETGREQNFSGNEKLQIFNELFKNNRRVSKKDLTQFLRNEYNIDTESIEGVENKFNASFSTYHDFLQRGIDRDLLDNPENEEMFEDIVKVLTIFEDKKMIREQLSKYESIISTIALKKLERRHYTGWGRLSAKLINGIREKHSQKTILDYLISDDGPSKNINRNLMQLINDDTLSFKAKIEQEQLGNIEASLHETVQKLTGSPAIKKGIYQSLKIVEEIVSIMGYEPTNIVVEMARETQTTSLGRSNSKPRLKSLEESIKNFGSDILKEYPTDNKSLQKDRLYLYYLQNGKDMYTGDSLDIHKLSNYDIDHIIPQSFTTDNSLDNRVLVSSAKNRGKSDDVPSYEVAKKMQGFWFSLYNSGLISQRKLNNLRKSLDGGLTEDDKAGFIKRQLVETRQITKNVARILHERYNNEKDENERVVRKVRVVTLKSALTSQFRKNFQIYKVREINDYHHAHDAYLNGVVAITLLRVYPQLEPELVYGEYPKFNSYKVNKATAKKQFYTNIMKFFARDETIVDDNGEILWDKTHVSAVKKVLSSRQMNIVKKTEVQSGGFSKESILPKGDSDKLIARKENWDTIKYGGFDSPVVAYSVIISHEKGKKKKVSNAIVGITIMDRMLFEGDEVVFLENKGYVNPKVIVKLPKYTLYVSENGRKRMLASAKEVQKANQLVLPEHLIVLLYHAKHSESLASNSFEYISEHRDEFSEIMLYVRNFSEKYTLADKNLEKITQLYEENKDGDIHAIAESFVNLMQFSAIGAPADFKFFGETIPRKRYTSTTELLKATIIYQSSTGLYETRMRLGD